VNQDDPTMYHLFYADQTGIPGMALTFFEMSYLASTYQATNAIQSIGLIVSTKAILLFWQESLDAFKLDHNHFAEYRERSANNFKDPYVLPLVHMAEENPASTIWQAWEHSTVPKEQQIRGMGTIEMKVRRLDKMVGMLTELFSYELVDKVAGAATLQ